MIMRASGALMAKARTSDNVAKDRHTTRTVNLRLMQALREATEKAAVRRATTVNDYVRNAIREALERDGFWPPPPIASTQRKLD